MFMFSYLDQFSNMTVTGDGSDARAMALMNPSVKGDGAVVMNGIDDCLPGPTAESVTKQKKAGRG